VGWGGKLANYPLQRYLLRYLGTYAKTQELTPITHQNRKHIKRQDPSNITPTMENEEENINHDLLGGLVELEMERLTAIGPTIINPSGEDVVPGSSDDPVMLAGSEEVQAAGIHLDWGEYYVPDEYIDSEEDDSSEIEEAYEPNKEEIKAELKNAKAELCAVLRDEVAAKTDIIYEDETQTTAPSNPSLMGLPDSVLEHVLHYSVDSPFDIIRIETVCKRVHKLTTCHDFWKRHTYKKRRKFRRMSTRKGACKSMAMHHIIKYQRQDTNIIKDVLSEANEVRFAHIFRTMSANVMRRMNHVGPEAQCILRGDTIGYICELLQGYMIRRLEEAFLLRSQTVLPQDWAKVKQGHYGGYEVTRRDIEFAFQGLSPFMPFSCQKPVKCNVSTIEHKMGASAYGCSCGISSSSGILWQWPLDDCRDTLPPEAGRRIIRRLAYRAGIPEMTNEAFVLAEAELLHALGVLLVDAYESSVELSKKSTLLKEDEEIVYNQPSYGALDIFKFPPPPFWKTGDGDKIYTVVPGQIRAAAERRGIEPCNVYGDAGVFWVTTPGFTLEEEMDIEESYYYEFRSHYEDVMMDDQVGTDEDECNASIDEESEESDSAAEASTDGDKNNDCGDDIDDKSNIDIDSDESWADNNSTAYDSEDLMEIESINSLN
jgi:hypothetical protein